MARFGLIVVLLALVLTGCKTPLPIPTAIPAVPLPLPGKIPAFEHVFIIVMENKDYADVLGSADAPFENQLAHTFATADRYYGVAHPSLPNYLALTSGSTQGMTYDCEDCSFDAPNLVDQLEAHQKTWIAYEEDLPRPCFNGTAAQSVVQRVEGSGYVRRHDPLMYYVDVATNAERCQHVVPMTGLADDLRNGRVPNFVWITPNLRHDTHNASVAVGDAWLQSTVGAILDSAAWKNGGVLFITWDEGNSNDGCCGNAAGGHVPMLVVAAAGKRDFHSPIPYSHYSLLRTIEDAWQLGHLGHAGDLQTLPMADFFS